MAKNAFESAAEEFRRAMQDHARVMRKELDRAREEIRSAMDRARAEIERARAEFERQMGEAREHMTDMKSRPFDFDDLLRPRGPSSKRRRPPRKPRGGEPAPVKPRPNPTPLVDGAEAPLD